MIETTRPSWQAARRILCVRLDSMGDVLMTTPAIAALKESMPGRYVTLLTSSAGADVARLVHEIDEVMIYEAPWIKNAAGHDNPGADLAFIESLRRRSFDAAIVFTVVTQSALPAAMMCHLAGIPLRLAHSRENPYGLLTDWSPDRPNDAFVHETQRQLDLVAAVGATTADDRLRLDVPYAPRPRVRRLLTGSWREASQAWAVVHTGATAASRRYPPEGFAAVIRALWREGVAAVLTGSQDERADVARVADLAGVPTLNLAGRLDLAELAALITDADLLVSNNSGPVHIAAAVGTPVVDLYAMTNPQHTPWRVVSRVLMNNVECGYCFKSTCVAGHHACLRGVSPESVVTSALELLAETSGAAAKEVQLAYR